MIKRIQQVIEEQVNPVIAQDNGSCEVVDFKGGIVSLRLLGECAGCPGKQNTLKKGIIPILTEEFDNIIDVQLVD